MFNPSIALSTEIAGVIIPSPYNNAAPKSPMPVMNIIMGPLFEGFTSCINASMPPSPSLSARIITSMYQTDIKSDNDQKTKDKTPSTFSSLTGTPWDLLKHSLTAYNGLVPISP